MVAELFQSAKTMKGGCVLFLDEVDSFCRQRIGTEDETSRRLKNEFLKHLDGMLVSFSQY